MLHDEIDRLNRDIDSLNLQLDALQEEYDSYVSLPLTITFTKEAWGETKFFSSAYDFDITPVYTLDRSLSYNFDALCDYLDYLLENIDDVQSTYTNIIVNSDQENRYFSIDENASRVRILAQNHDAVFSFILSTKTMGDQYSMVAFTSNRPITPGNPQVIRVSASAKYSDKQKTQSKSFGQSLAHMAPYQVTMKSVKYSSMRLLKEDRHYYQLNFNFDSETTPIMTDVNVINWWW